MSDIVTASLAAIERTGPVGWIAVVAVQFVVAVSGILPASMIGMAAGVIYGVVLGFLLSSAGILLGAVGVFWLTRSMFRPWIARLLPQRSLALNFDRLVARDGWKLACLIRISPIIPFVASSYMLGLSSISFRAYLVGTLAALPALLGYVALGTLANAGLAAWTTNAGAVRWGLLGLGLGATVLLTLRSGWLIRRAVGQMPDGEPGIL